MADSFQPPPGPGEPPESAEVPYEPAGEAHADVLTHHRATLLAIPGVVGVALGNEGIVVYVTDAEAATRVPPQLDGVPLVPTVTGQIDAQTP